MEEREMDGQRVKEGVLDSAKTSNPARPSLKIHPFFNNYDFWKHKLRENCYKRVREDRKRLLWKTRAMPTSQPINFGSKDFIKSAFKDIVSDELKKLKNSSSDNNMKMSTSIPDIDDVLWEYDGHHDAYQGECEEILMEMQRIFYDDLRMESARKEPENYVETWEDQEDEYLACSIYEKMQLNEKQEVIWCPICKRGELQENQSFISCSLCELQLKKGDEVNLELLRVRLAEVHADHLDRGCALRPKFCIETRVIGMMYQIIRGAICSHMVHSSVLKWISHIPDSPDSSAIRIVHFLIQDDLQKSKTITIPVVGDVGAYFSAFWWL